MTFIYTFANRNFTFTLLGNRNFAFTLLKKDIIRRVNEMKTYIYISGDEWPSFTLLQIAISHLHFWKTAIYIYTFEKYSEK
jgi:hypothetical protein